MKKIKNVWRYLTRFILTKKRKYELAEQFFNMIVLSYKSNGITLNMKQRNNIYNSCLNALKLKKK